MNFRINRVHILKVIHFYKLYLTPLTLRSLKLNTTPCPPERGNPKNRCINAFPLLGGQGVIVNPGSLLLPIQQGGLIDLHQHKFHRENSFRHIISVVLCLISLNTFAQSYYAGNDISYANMMEDCGADFKENGVSKDVYQIFADHGTNLIRVRLWHTPTWQNSISQPDGVRNQYNDFEDVHEALERAKAAGMNTMIGFHFSDAWADPGRQVIPAAWQAVANNLTVLKDSVYNYVVNTLNALHKDGLLPDIIKVGNEANPGMMVYETMDDELNASGWIDGGWSRQAQLYNAAISAVRDFSDTTELKPQIALHCADPEKAASWYNNIINYGVTDFDIIGFSFYYTWHDNTIAEVGSVVANLKYKHPSYEVMLIETGYLWSTKNFDNYFNIIDTPDPSYKPVSPQKQLEYMIDLQRAVLKNGGIGCVFWEPDWVSTPCKTLWGTGSQHEHVAYFDPTNTNFMNNGGGRWMEPQFYENINSPKITFKVDVDTLDVSNGVYLKGSWSDEYYPMLSRGNNIYSFAIYEINPNDTVGYYFTTDTTDADARETIPDSCALWKGTDRQFIAGTSNETVLMFWESCNENDPNASNINNLETINDWYISPNPGKDIINIHFSDAYFHGNIEVLDLNGRSQLNDKIQQNEQIKSLDISELSPGIYIIQISSDTGLGCRKLLVI